ncbi:MAG: hypothetical protein ACXABO_18955 [Promethearchaeota archaeon]|jgi:hypothetical protein
MKTEKIKCPLCSVEFIPRFFHLEKEKYEVTAPVHIVNRFKFKSSNGGFQPPNIVSRSWVTACPECRYIIKFAAEMGKKEFLAQDSRSFLNLREFKENGKHYEYKFYKLDKPYKEAHYYNKDLIGQLKEKILKVLDGTILSDWGFLYKTWRIDSQIDSFKFLIRFLSYIEKYVMSLKISIDLDTIIAKVGALYIPYEIKENLISLIRIRQKTIEEYYELTRKDEELLQKTYNDLTMEILFQEMASLHLNKINIPEDPLAFDREFYYLELKALLQNYLKNTLYIREYPSFLIITMLNRLKITLG